MPQTFPLSKKFAIGDANIEVDATNNIALAQAIAAGQAFPSGTGDVGLAGFSVGLPDGGKSLSVNTPAAPFQFQFSGQASQGLGSYTTLAAAVAQAGMPAELPVSGLLPETPGLRYTAFCGALEAGAGVTATIALAPSVTVPIGLNAATSARYAAIAAVDAGAPVLRQLQSVFTGLVLPLAVDSADDLQADTAVLCRLGGTLQASAGIEVGYNYNFLRQVAEGEIQGDLGLAVNVAASATAMFTLSGAFTLALTRDGETGVRVRLYKDREIGFDFAAQLDVDAKATIPNLPKRPEDLISAILGIHELQWLKAVHDRIVQVEMIAADKLKQLFDAWDGLDAKAAALIWNAAGNQADVAMLHEWIHRIATELTTHAAFQTAIRGALANVPGFATGPVAQWIEAESGNLLAPVTSLPQYQQLVKAATALDNLFSQEGLQSALGQLKQAALKAVGVDTIEQSLRSLTDYQKLDAWVRQQIENAFGRVIASDADLQALNAKLQNLYSRRQEIYDKAIAALKNTYGASISLAYQASTSSTALLDATFDLGSAAGKDAFRKALRGDVRDVLSRPADGVALHEGVLTHGLKRRSLIEVHLPFLNPQEWSHRLDALGSVEVHDSPDGRVFAYTVTAEDQVTRKDRYQCTLSLTGTVATIARHSDAAFTLAYAETLHFANAKTSGVATRLAPAVAQYRLTQQAGAGPAGDRFRDWITGIKTQADVDTVLTLSIPGSMVSAWLTAPTREADYRDMAQAVQTRLRVLLPVVYFSDIDRFKDLDAAWPLLVWAAGQFPPAPKLAWDPQDPAQRDRARLSAAPILPNRLRVIHDFLAEEGGPADRYLPEDAGHIIDSVKDSEQFRSLLQHERGFTSALVTMGKRAAKLPQKFATKPRNAVKDLTGFAAELVSNFNSGLEDLYGGVAFRPFGAMLLVEATHALAAAQPAAPERIEGTLAVNVGGIKTMFVTANELAAAQSAR